jgi:acetoin utilization protein AcuC
MKVGVAVGPAMASYGFLRGSRPDGGHWFSPDRFAAFHAAFTAAGLDGRVVLLGDSSASDAELAAFHTPGHIAWVRARCAEGTGALDHGPTPAQLGIDGAADAVVGAVLDGGRRLLVGELDAAFVPIAGFHHAFPDGSRNYCVWNDAAVAIAAFAGKRIAYVDIDVHLGDGVMSAFAEDPRVLLVDVHQDGRTFWYGEEVELDVPDGVISIALPPGAGDDAFFAVWPRCVAAVDAFRPDLIVLNAGADGLAGDRLGGLTYTVAVHRTVTADLRRRGPILVVGGGGYHLDNLAAAWTEVVAALVADG